MPASHTDALSPALTASSSTTAYNALDNNEGRDNDVSMDKMQDFNELFDFDHFESSASSHSHSPNTISPNHTPSPLPNPGSPFIPADYDFFNQPAAHGDGMDFGFDYAPLTEKAPPAPFVKQEPVEFGFPPDPSLASTSSLSQSPIVQTSLLQQSPPQQAATPDFNGLPADQQLALQQLLSNMMNYQKQFGVELPGVGTTPAVAPTPQSQPSTIEPSLVFSSAPSTSTTFSSTAPSAAISPVASTSVPAAKASPVKQTAPLAVIDEQHEDHDHDQLISIEDHEQPSRNDRQGSIMSSFSLGADDIDSKLEALIPSSAIFSAGRGKGGKKGGGMSSVVRGDDEDVDDEDSWRPSPEEYKKLSSKEKRQLRNKLSARAFRNRRKDYIGTLEGHIKDRDTVIDAMRAELSTSKTENQDLRRELEALKASTMSILHPESAKSKAQPPSVLNAFTLPATFPAATPAPRRAPSPKFNPRKDLPSSSAMFETNRGFWGNNDPLGGGGSTTCHTMFTPDLVLPEQELNPLKGIDMPRYNINPRLNEPTASTSRMPALSAQGNAKELGDSFSNWSESTPFTLRSMDSYRIQMWSRLAREAQAEKSGIAADLRPKFFTEASSSTTSSVDPATAQAAAVAGLAAGHITSKLASSFWSAFSSTAGGLDADKLTAVVTGKARLRVVEDDTDAIANALSGLRIQSGQAIQTSSSGLGAGWRVRENPLGALGCFFKCAGPVST